MIENSLMQSNFLGRDGFKWWVGQVAPEEAQGKQINGDGWGNRVKVRIMGYHPDNDVELKNEDLPWAHILKSPEGGLVEQVEVNLLKYYLVIMCLDSF